MSRSKFFAALLILPLLALALGGTASRGFAQKSPPAQAEKGSGVQHPQEGATPMPSGMPMGMMGQGRSAGMMGCDMNDMTSMMRNMMAMMSAQSDMMAANVEARIASLKAELKVTDSQAANWDRFADALRSTAKSMSGMHRTMMQPGVGDTLPARLDRENAALSTHLTSMKGLKEALEPLYSSLSDEQKKIVDGMMIGPMGVM